MQNYSLPENGTYISKQNDAEYVNAPKLKQQKQPALSRRLPCH